MTEESDGDGNRDGEGGDDSGDDVWARVYGLAVAGVVAVVGVATLTSAGIGSPISRVLFAVTLGVVVGQAAKAL